MPATATIDADRGEVEHREGRRRSAPARTRETMMFGEVPISVIRPPSSEPKAIGIRKTEGDTPERRANWKAIGIMIASAPMFLTKADSTVTTTTSSDELQPHRAHAPARSAGSAPR